MAKIIGIDLGTTFSAMAIVNEHGRPEILPNREGERITPSVVLFDDDAPLVGSIAKRSAVASPLNVVQFVKRQMGDPAWKFRTEGGVAYTPEEISAIILKRLKEDAESLLGESIEDAVITVPAYFNDAQRKATQDAGKIAGLNVLRIINEPTAAALAYGIEKAIEDETVLVYDLGGGTFDVTIMKIAKNEIAVLATSGDKNLGGFDWDNLLMEYLNEEFKSHGGIDLLNDPATEQDLRDKVEIAKKTLSARDKASVFLSAGGKTHSIALTLDTFNTLTESLLKRTVRIMEMVLEDANLNWGNIDKVLLVGGSTRMRAVAAIVQQVTGKKPSMELHPDEVVALGAAMQGAVLLAENNQGSKALQNQYALVVIQDVCSHSMGVIAADDSGSEFNSIILKKGTAIPCEVSELYQTSVDRQTAVNVQVTEGEDSDPQYVVVRDAREMKVPPHEKGAPLRVTFRYNENGRIRVEVFDLTDRKSLGEFDIVDKAQNSDADVARLAKKMSTLVVS